MRKLVAVLLGVSFIIVGGCGEPSEKPKASTGHAEKAQVATKVDVGTTKSDVLRILGRPRNWATILPNGQLTITTVYSNNFHLLTPSSLSIALYTKQLHESILYHHLNYK